MTLPANAQQAAVPWGVEAIVCCWGTEGGPYHVCDTVNPLPVSVQNTVTVTVQPGTSGGLTPWRSLDVQPGGAVVKASAGQVKGYYLANNASAVRYVKLYDKATTPTSGDTPVETIALPANSAANRSIPDGIQFANGIGIRGTTGAADNDTGAPTAGDLIANVEYK